MRGHVALAVEAIGRFELDRLVVLVVAEPGHKPVQTPVEDRVELARAAFAGVPLAEVRREEHAYTVDSLRAGDFDPETTVFLVGADEFADFLTWKDYDEILDRVRLGVATRPGYPARAARACARTPCGDPTASSSSRSQRSTSPRRTSALGSNEASRPTRSCLARSPTASSSGVSTMKAVDLLCKAELR